MFPVECMANRRNFLMGGIGMALGLSDAVSDVVLPRRQRSAQRFFSVEEIQRILEAAPEPHFTLYWIGAETGMRAGELCGLRINDFDLERRLVRVNRSVWRGKTQSTKKRASGQVLCSFTSTLCTRCGILFALEAE